MNAVDTNVLIYACDKRKPFFQERALNVLEELDDGVMLWQVACEFVSASRKLSDQGFTAKMAWGRLQEFIEIFPLQIPSESIFEITRSLHMEKHVAYWDALIIAAALDAGVKRIYSEDLPGSLPPEGLEIINPFA